MKKIVFIMLIIVLFGMQKMRAAISDTTIYKWKDNKVCAFSICADDTMISQADFMVPKLIEKGFVGLFWANPGHPRYIARKDLWDNWMSSGDVEFGNHGWSHTGCTSYDDADQVEIGGTANYIWNLRPSPPKSMLQLFLSGGGTTWNITSEEFSFLLNKYHCISGRGGGTRIDSYVTGLEYIQYIDEIIASGEWYMYACHGIGPDGEYLVSDGDAFITMIDYLEEKQDQIWVADNLSVHKYKEEYDSASMQVVEANPSIVRLNLTSAKDVSLYDEPLGLVTEIPTGWNFCRITQGVNVNTHLVRTPGVIQYEAIPSSGEIVMESVTINDTTPPSTPSEVRDGTEGDTDVAYMATQLSANWDASTDPESFILRYWYAIGTTQGGTDVIDWTDNGDNTSVTRTGLTLTEGVTYYFTVKAENGVNIQGSPASSNGQCVILDVTLPAKISVVRDGTLEDVDTIYSAAHLSANWEKSGDSESGISKYWYAIGTTPGGTDTVTWTDNGTGIKVTHPGLSLNIGTIYYFTVKAENGAGLHSLATNSDGQLMEGDNLALNKSVEASSNESSGVSAEYAVDGNMSTRWASSFSDPQWIKVDLGATHAINKVVLHWETAYGKSYEIQVSLNGSTWKSVYSTTSSDGGIDDIDLTEVIDGRYVKMYGTERGTTWGYSLWEFEVFSPLPGWNPPDGDKSDSLDNIKIYPNPFLPDGANPMVFTDLPAKSVLKIYTLSGKLVCKLNEVDYGWGEISWNGTNEKGAVIAPGLYIYVITDEEGNKKSGKFVLK